MKQLFALVFFLITSIVSAQTPQTISYQAILRDNVGALIQNANNVGVHVSIIQGALIENNVVYVEDHSTTTNANGLFTIQIGNGDVAAGNYPSIQWGSGPFFLKTEIDPLGGTNYLITAISELLSVPFANYANQAGRHPGVAGLLEGHWAPISDGLETGSIFIQYISQTAVMISMYTGPIGDLWKNDIVRIQGDNLLGWLDPEFSFTFVLSQDQLTISFGDGISSSYARQF